MTAIGSGHTAPATPRTSPTSTGLEGTVVIRRSQRMVGRAIPLFFELDGRPIGNLEAGGSISIVTLEGPHVVRVFSPSSDAAAGVRQGATAHVNIDASGCLELECRVAILKGELSILRIAPVPTSATGSNSYETPLKVTNNAEYVDITERTLSDVARARSLRVTFRLLIGVPTCLFVAGMLMPATSLDGRFVAAFVMSFGGLCVILVGAALTAALSGAMRQAPAIAAACWEFMRRTPAFLRELRAEVSRRSGQKARATRSERPGWLLVPLCMALLLFPISDGYHHGMSPLSWLLVASCIVLLLVRLILPWFVFLGLGKSCLSLVLFVATVSFAISYSGQEAVMWRRVSSLDRFDGYRDYLKQHPSGQHATGAHEALDRHQAALADARSLVLSRLPGTAGDRWVRATILRLLVERARVGLPPVVRVEVVRMGKGSWFWADSEVDFREELISESIRFVSTLGADVEVDQGEGHDSDAVVLRVSYSAADIGSYKAGLTLSASGIDLKATVSVLSRAEGTIEAQNISVGARSSGSYRKLKEVFWAPANKILRSVRDDLDSLDMKTRMEAALTEVTRRRDPAPNTQITSGDAG